MLLKINLTNYSNPLGLSSDLKNNPDTYCKYTFENITTEFKPISDSISCWVKSTSPNFTYKLNEGTRISNVVEYTIVIATNQLHYYIKCFAKIECINSRF